MRANRIVIGVVLLTCVSTALLFIYTLLTAQTSPATSIATVSTRAIVQVLPSPSPFSIASLTSSPTVDVVAEMATMDMMPSITPNARQLSIYEIFPDGDAGGPPFLRGWNSMWHIGAVPGSKPYNLLDLYVLARRPLPPGRTPVSYGEMYSGAHATLATGLSGNDITQEIGRRFIQVWECPEDVGTITITGVQGPTVSPTGPTGIVSFKTSTHLTGTFDLATHK